MKAVIVGCVRDSESYIDNVFNNINKIKTLFEDCPVVLFYDKSKDKTYQKIKSHDCIIIENKKPLLKLRTHRISYGRNECLKYVRNNYRNYDFLMVMDMDDVNSGSLNLNVLKDSLNETNKWDGLTFNREDYYDIFALHYNKFTYNCWSYGPNSVAVVNLIKKDIVKQLKTKKYYQVNSAFNGFGIYKLNKYIDSEYSAFKSGSKNQLDIPVYDIEDNCEHIRFHVKAKLLKKAKLMINQNILFNDINYTTNETKYGKISLYKNEQFIKCDLNKYWDEDTLLLLKKYIDPSKNILEIGGHSGTSSIVYSSFLDSKSKLYVYEPQKEMFNLLNLNIQQNNLTDKIIPYNKAVFCYNGKANMNKKTIDGMIVDVNHALKNGNILCNYGGLGLGSHGEEIETLTINSMPHENIGFIHIDTQGAENYILSQSEDFIKKNRPVIYFEDNYNEHKEHYNNVKKSYPEWDEYSEYDIVDFVMNQMNYKKIIRKFNGGIDCLLIP